MTDVPLYRTPSHSLVVVGCAASGTSSAFPRSVNSSSVPPN